MTEVAPERPSFLLSLTCSPPHLINCDQPLYRPARPAIVIVAVVVVVAAVAAAATTTATEATMLLISTLTKKKSFARN